MSKLSTVLGTLATAALVAAMIITGERNYRAAAENPSLKASIVTANNETQTARAEIAATTRELNIQKDTNNILHAQVNDISQQNRRAASQNAILTSQLENSVPAGEVAELKAKLDAAEKVKAAAEASAMKANENLEFAKSMEKAANEELKKARAKGSSQANKEADFLVVPQTPLDLSGTLGEAGNSVPQAAETPANQKSVQERPIQPRLDERLGIGPNRVPTNPVNGTLESAKSVGRALGSMGDAVGNFFAGFINMFKDKSPEPENTKL